jgi:hypothetical protein
MDFVDMNRDTGIKVIQEGYELYLTFASETSPIDLACASVKRCEEVQSTLAIVFMFNQHGFAGLCRFGRFLWRTRLKRCLLVQTKHHLIESKLPGVKITDFHYDSTKCFIPRCFGTKPHVASPRFQMVVVQNSSYGVCGNGFNNAI